jgi:hypothetical protein
MTYLPCYQNIKVWFNNHGRETSGKTKNANLLDLSKRPKKTKLQSWQAYSRLYFDDRVKSTFYERLKGYEMELEAGTISKMPKRLGVLRKVTTEKLEGESDEVKAEVERYRRIMIKRCLMIRRMLLTHLRKVPRKRNKPQKKRSELHKHRST